MKTIKVLLCLVASLSFQASHASYGSHEAYLIDPTVNFRRAVAAGVKGENLKKLFEKPDVDVRINEHGDTPLLQAAVTNDLVAINVLLDNGAGINKHDNNGNTALLCAILHYKVDAFDLLVARKADINKANTEKLFPLLAIIQKLNSVSEVESRLRTISWALKMIGLPEIDIDRQNSEGKTALMAACQHGSIALSKALLVSNLSSTDKDGNTALAIAQQQKEVAKKSNNYDRYQVLSVIVEEIEATPKRLKKLLSRWITVPGVVDIIALDYLIAPNAKKASATAAAPTSPK